MLNYIHADLHRIFRRIPRCVFIILFYAIILGVECYQAVSKSYNSVNLMADSPTFFGIASLVLGIVELQSVFSDDFRAKTMQIAIGLGLSRPKVVLVKLLDVAILSVVDQMVLMFLFILGGMGCGISLLGDQIRMLVVSALGCALSTILMTALTMIPLFYLQSTSLAILFFLLISADPLQLILAMFSTNEIVLNLHLQELPYSVVTSTLTTQLALGNTLPIPQLLGTIAYLVLAYGLTVLVFRKRELDF